jgi:hypothetical protein
METDSAKPLAVVTPDSTAFKILGAIGFSHLLNDMIQSLIPALYPLLKESLSLSFIQIGLIMFIRYADTCPCWACLRFFCQTSGKRLSDHNFI